MILGIRLGRRLLAAAALDGDAFVFANSRFSPNRKSLLSGMGRYFRDLLEQTQPRALYCYAPVGTQTLTAQMLGVLEQEAARVGVPVKPLSKSEVLGSFGVLPLRMRRDLRQCIECLWPELAEAKPQRQVVLAEAAAAALVGDFQQGMIGA